jgi:hypothetical protein
MRILLLVFIGMMSAFLAESCQGDRTQGQQSILKISKSTVERGTYTEMHKYYYNNVSPNKQNRERRGSAVFMINRHTKFHILSCNGTLVIAFKRKAKYRLHVAVMLLFHIPQYIIKTKVSYFPNIFINNKFPNLT